MKTREQIKQELYDLLFNQAEILAVWEGGSAATGYLDEFSDLDLAIICSDDAVEKVFATLENFLKSFYGIIKKFRLPEPTWHGFSQCYYQLDQVPELFYLDVGVLKKSLPDKFTESNRHGNAVVWFQKEEILNTAPAPPEKVRDKGRQFINNVTNTDFIAILEIKKALARHNFCDAFQIYYQFVNRNLGPLLNLKYCPAKVDFGFAYTSREYAQADADLINNAFCVLSLEELKQKYVQVHRRYLELVEELSPDWM